MDSLPVSAPISGHDAYCHVCWEDFYRLWVGPEAPPNHECPLGAKRATDCANAMSRARLRADLAGLRERGLLPSPTP